MKGSFKEYNFIEYMIFRILKLIHLIVRCILQVNLIILTLES